MPVFEDPRCPRCQGAVPLRDVWKAASWLGDVIPAGRIGIVCLSCGEKLRVLQYRAWLAMLGGFAIVVATLAALADFERAHDVKLTEGEHLFITGALLVGLYFLGLRYAYRFAAIRSLREGEEVSFSPWGWTAALDSIEEQDIDIGILSRVTDNPAGTATASAWICSKCKEENPGEFDVCWKCQTPRNDG